MAKATRKNITKSKTPPLMEGRAEGQMAPDQIDLALHEIVSMVEFLHRELEKQICDDKNKAFSIAYADMNLIDFAICDIDRRVKELRKSIQH